MSKFGKLGLVLSRQKNNKLLLLLLNLILKNKIIIHHLNAKLDEEI
jgi:hypothetical protein